MKTLSKENKFQDFSIIVKYIGPTNTKGTRFSINSPYFKKTKYLPWDYSLNSTLDQIGKILIDNSMDVISYSELPNKYILTVSWDDGKKLFKI